MADKMQISIIGLGLIGASAGLALRKYADKVMIVGHDKDTAAAGRAKNLGAVDKTEWNLINAVRGADRILLALPLEEIRKTLEAIRDDLRENVVLVDTASVKAPVMQWAGELLPAHASLVGGHPILVSEGQGTAAASAELFKGHMFCLVTDAHTQGPALQIATDLVEALGGRPFFIDAAEHDGLAAAVEHLPALLAAALAAAATGSSSWNEMRKLAGSQFYTSTFEVENDPAALAALALGNKRNLLRWMDNLAGELDRWRGYLEAGDEKVLGEAFDEAMTQVLRWNHRYETGDWDEGAAQPEVPTMGEGFRRMLGFGGRPREKGKQGDKGTR